MKLRTFCGIAPSLRGGAMSVLLCFWLALGTFGCEDDESDAGLGRPGQRRDGGHESDVRSSCGAVGSSTACTGADGCDGVQTCRSDGTYGECACEATEPAPEGCAPQGTVAVCTGEGACSGLQSCGDDGRFGPCRCPQPPDEPARAVRALEISAPLEGDRVIGPFEIAGSARGHVAAVRVSVGGGPWLLAEGKDAWRLTFDPAVLPYGPVMIVAVAQGEDGSELQRWLQVQHEDPLVGSWRRTGGNYDRQKAYYCVLTFEATGEFVDSECDYSPLAGRWVWRRLHGDVIALGGWQDSDLRFVATLSADRERLRIEHGGAGSRTFETFVRLDSDSDDAGVEDDAGH